MDPLIIFIPINGVPTKIVIWDDNLKQSDLENVSKIKFNYKRLILFITGNPGEIDYYRQYLAELHSKTKLPVIGISNAGHNRIPESLCKPDINKENENLFGLEAQIVHKAKFIQEFIDSNTRLIIPTHSVGCYVTLELLDRYPEINKMIDHCILLFPTIHSMRETKIGGQINFLFQYFYYLILFLAYCCETFLSQESRIKLMRKILQSRCPNVSENVVQSATNLLDPYCLKATIVMVLDEFRIIDLPKIPILESNADKLSLFYSENDHWAPVEYYHYLKEKVSDHSIPLDLRLNLGKMDHAFVEDPKNIPLVLQLTYDVIQKKWNL